MIEAAEPDPAFRLIRGHFLCGITPQFPWESGLGIRDLEVTGNPQNPIVLIPARLASIRLPGKPLADIGGEPMIVHVWRRAMPRWSR